MHLSSRTSTLLDSRTGTEGSESANTGVALASGRAHDVQLGTVILGNAAQQGAQHDAVRARHGSSRSQTTHEA
jgi:hypothetical protein